MERRFVRSRVVRYASQLEEGDTSGSAFPRKGGEIGIRRVLRVKEVKDDSTGKHTNVVIEVAGERGGVKANLAGNTRVALYPSYRPEWQA